MRTNKDLTLLYEALEEQDIPKIDQLITNNKNLLSQCTSSQIHPIHYVCQFNKPAALQYLLTKDFTLFRLEDNQGKRPLDIAKRYKHKECINHLRHHRHIYHFLQNVGQNKLKQVTQALERDPNLVNAKIAKAAPLLVAIEHNLFQMTATLIQLGASLSKEVLDYAAKKADPAMETYLLGLSAKKNLQQTLEWVTTPQQVLDILIAVPDQLNAIIYHEKIKNLLDNEPGFNLKNEKIHWYSRAKGKRLSSFAYANLKEKDSFDFYTSPKLLGEGGLGVVRKLESPQGKVLAVKSFICNVSSDKRPIVNTLDKFKAEKNSAKVELAYNKLVYPSNNQYALFHYKEADKYDYRMIKPLTEGISLLDYINHLLDQNADDTWVYIAFVILRMAESLHALHCKGIIHGDASIQNVLVEETNDDLLAHFLDFGMTYCIFDDEPMPIDKINETVAPERAPELMEKNPIQPHFNQDIFTLGYNLKFILKELNNSRVLQDYFPSIEKFANSATQIQPENRPTLSSFIDELSEEYLSFDALLKNPTASTHSDNMRL